MRISAIVLMILTMLMGCNPGTPSPPAKTSPPPVMSKDGGLKVMTADDMAKLQEDRKDMINRPSPLGEEIDAVEAARKQAAGK